MNVWYFDPYLMEPRHCWIKHSQEDDKNRFSGGSFHGFEYFLIGNLALLEKAQDVDIFIMMLHAAPPSPPGRINVARFTVWPDPTVTVQVTDT